MNERIAKLYDQAIMLESNGDYVAGELDPVKFAELIVRECANIAFEEWQHNGGSASGESAILKYFGVEE
jgi:hypothetical protein